MTARTLLTRLVARADVLMENFRTGVLDRLGFSMERLHEINPRLVVLSITGFGHDGPEGGRAGYDQIAQGEAGLMSLTGPSADEPTRVGVPIGDLLAGMYGAYGVLAALHERESTGRGRVVRTSLLASVVGVHAYQGTRWTVGHEVPHALGNHHPSIAPYGLFHAADAPVQIACGNEQQWKALARPARDRPTTGSPRTGPGSGCAPSWSRPSRTPSPTPPAESWLDASPRSASRPARSARSTTSTPGTRRSRKACSSTSTTRPLGTVQLPGPPLRFDDNLHAGARTTHLPPPRLGEHDASVRAWLDALDAKD